MNEQHYKEKLSEFINHELANDERQAIGEHLLLCADCRAEHDQIKLGADLASQLKHTDAPENLWNRIENALDGKEKAKSFFFAEFSVFQFARFGGNCGFVNRIWIVCGILSRIFTKRFAGNR